MDDSKVAVPLMSIPQTEAGGVTSSDIANYSYVNAAVEFNTQMKVVSRCVETVLRCYL